MQHRLSWRQEADDSRMASCVFTAYSRSSVVKRAGWHKVRKIVGTAVLAVIGVFVIFHLVNYTNGSVVSSGIERHYLVHVPPSYDPSKPTPLVITLHGFAQLPLLQNSVNHWSDLADQEGFIVVYPAGSYFPLRWETGGAYRGISDPGWDITFIADLIDKLEQEYNIDPARIYANGFSNGAGASFIMSCALSERIAAVGLASGAYLYSWQECQPARPVPAIVFHGTADTTVPYQGGVAGLFRVQFPAITGWVQTLAQRNGCSADPQAIPAYGDVDAVRYTGCQADVVFYSIHDGEHDWPGSERYAPNVVSASGSIDATRAMWAFFEQHPLDSSGPTPVRHVANRTGSLAVLAQ